MGILGIADPGSRQRAAESKHLGCKIHDHQKSYREFCLLQHFATRRVLQSNEEVHLVFHGSHSWDTTVQTLKDGYCSSSGRKENHGTGMYFAFEPDLPLLYCGTGQNDLGLLEFVTQKCRVVTQDVESHDWRVMLVFLLKGCVMQRVFMCARKTLLNGKQFFRSTFSPIKHGQLPIAMLIYKSAKAPPGVEYPVPFDKTWPMPHKQPGSEGDSQV